MQEIGIIQTIAAPAGGILTAYAFSAFRFVPKPWNWVVEINRPNKETVAAVWKPGIHFMAFPVPPIMRIANKLYCADLPIVITMGKTDDNLGDPSLIEFIDTSCSIKMQIITRVKDPLKATYEVDDYVVATVNLIEAKIRQDFAQVSLEEAMIGDTREESIQELLLLLFETLTKWGVEINSLAILDFDLPQDIIDQRNKKIQAEKDREVKVILAEGEARAKIILAEAEGQAKWKLIMSIAKKVKLEPVQVIAWLLNQQLLDAMEASTLIVSTNKEGNLNLPHIDMAATMAAIQQTIANSNKS